LALVSGLGSHSARQRDRRLVVGEQGPVEPPHKPMDRGVSADLVDWGLTVAIAVAITTVGESVGPRREHLPASVRRTLIDGETVDHIPPADSEVAQGGAHLADLHLRVGVRDRELVTRWWSVTWRLFKVHGPSLPNLLAVRGPQAVGATPAEKLDVLRPQRTATPWHRQRPQSSRTAMTG